MPDPGLDQVRNTPAFKVLHNGSPLAVETDLDILEVRVSQYLNGPSAFEITLSNWDSDKQEFKWTETDTFNIGGKIEIQLGYVDKLSTLFKGEITGIEPTFQAKDSATVCIRGFDSLHRLTRGRRSRTYESMKDSDIVSQIGGQYGLQTQADDTSITHDHVYQHNQTDLEFLLTRARRLDFELLIESDKLLFRKRANDRTKTVTVQSGSTLKEFSARLSTMQQVGKVIVRGWNPSSKQEITATAQPGDETTKMGASKLGASSTDQAFPGAETIIVADPIFSDGEALQIAKGKFNNMTMDFITAEGVAIGDTNIRAGAVIEVTAAGKRFSGLYYVDSAIHSVDKKGYTIRFTARRNAL